MLEENGGSVIAMREVNKWCNIFAKYLLLFYGLLSLLRKSYKYLTPWKIQKAQKYSNKALKVWRIMQLYVNPKFRGSEYCACNQLGFLWILSDFCEDWDEQLHRLGLKNNRQTKTIRNRYQK